MALSTLHEVPYFVLGNGSNLLMSDHGPGPCSTTHWRFYGSEVSPNCNRTLRVGADLLNVLLARAAKNEWTGLECFAGIPGTIGGAIRMNAGATLGETKDCLLEVQVVLKDGKLRTLTVDELRMSYRTTHLPADSIVAFAQLRLSEERPQIVFSGFTTIWNVERPHNLFTSPVVGPRLQTRLMTTQDG